jgi:uncharacterized protein
MAVAEHPPAEATGAEDVESQRPPSAKRRLLEPWPRPTSRARQWTVRYALLAYVVSLAFLLALGGAFSLLDIHLGIGVSALITESTLLATLVPLARRGAVGPRDLGFWTVPGGRSTAMAVLALLLYGVANVVSRSVTHPHAITSNFANISHHSTVAIVLAGFVACIGAPVAEEVFFRGFLYRSLRNRMGIAPACLIAAALFALVHTQYPVSGRLVVGSFGVLMCLLYERTGSLLPGIAVHSFVDASGFERALSGNSPDVATLFLLLAVILLAGAPMRGLGRLMSGKPAFRDFSTGNVQGQT